MRRKKSNKKKFPRTPSKFVNPDYPPYSGDSDVYTEVEGLDDGSGSILKRSKILIDRMQTGYVG